MGFCYKLPDFYKTYQFYNTFSEFLKNPPPTLVRRGNGSINDQIDPGLATRHPHLGIAGMKLGEVHVTAHGLISP